MQILRELEGLRVDQQCCENGLALGPGQGSHTAQPKLWTAATIAPLGCGPKKPEPGQQMLQPWPRKLRPIAMAEVLMKLAESCVIEQHIERPLKRS